MSYRALKLGSRTQSRESTDSSFRKIDSMLFELYDDLTDYATQSYVSLQISNLVNSAPATLNTLKELADALGSDANFSTTISTSLGNRLRVDVNTQGLDNTQKSNARTNLGLATVASSGSYTDLTDKPTIVFSYNDLTNKPVLFSGSYADLTDKPTMLASDRLVNGSHTLILDSDGDVTVSTGSMISPAFVTTSASSIFQRPLDTGLNIRGDVSDRPIYMYTYGSDGIGTGGGEIDIKNDRVDIYADWGTANQSKWSFRNIYDGQGAAAGIIETPHMILGTVNDEDQLISVTNTHNLTIGNTGFKSYIRINPVSSGSANDNKISLQSNTTSDLVEGLGFTSEGAIEIEAGGNHSPSAASLTMGKGNVDASSFPPPAYGEAIHTATTHSKLGGGLLSFGDIVITGGSKLHTRGGVVFFDGSLQDTAYTGSTINSKVDDPVTINARYDQRVVATSDSPLPGKQFFYAWDNETYPDLGTSQVRVGWIVNGPGLGDVEVINVSHSEGFSQIFIDENRFGDSVEFQPEEEYTFTNTVAKSWVFELDGELTLPDGGSITIRGDVPTIRAQTNQLFDDAVAKNSEVNSIQGTINNLQGELSYWQSIASGNPQNPQYGQAQSEISRINSEIAVLLSSLNTAQGELAVLQNNFNSTNALLATPSVTLTYDIEDRVLDINRGGVRFPDDTVQTTAYQKVAVPAHSYGAAGDVAGMIAFDASYIYYCTADYVDNVTDIWKRTAHGSGTW